MTTTTNRKSKFFRKKLRKNLSSVFNLSIILFVIALLIFIFCQKEKSLNVQTLKINQGWGYTITNNNRVIIKQTVIPVISEQKSFQTEKEAMTVGQLVIKKLNANKSPTITKNELILLKIRL
ncbi:DUF4907 domain-containing protein [Flavobacterium sp. A45]|uniref:DUF4907 domain-containing protein n=1 Tax=Flavobacterium sp. A45 TaxID=1945862 RepID=UPI0009841C37|nr:DUF4907 domain-containing protein [Flavobacterium sp. A45]OOG74651.1 hypothetical protein B0E44_05635 [Flavobacterium sp. A45]